MSCKEFPGGMSVDTRHDVSGAFHPIWGSGVAFYQTEPWPQFACFQDYDTGEPRFEDGKKIVEFEFANGSAVYEVIEDCEYGAGFHCRLVKSTYEPVA